MAVDIPDKRHGGPYDRGGADAYYSHGRICRPHFFEGATNKTPRIEPPEMTEAQVREYLAGFRATVDAGDFKDWG